MVHRTGPNVCLGIRFLSGSQPVLFWVETGSVDPEVEGCSSLRFVSGHEFHVATCFFRFGFFTSVRLFCYALHCSTFCVS